MVCRDAILLSLKLMPSPSAKANGLPSAGDVLREVWESHSERLRTQGTLSLGSL